MTRGVTCPTTRSVTRPTSLGMLLAIGLELLSKLTPGTNRRALPVEDVNRNQDQETNQSQERTRPLQTVLVAHVLVHGRRVHGRDTGKEITRESIATGR